MNSSIRFVDKFRIVLSIVAIAPLCLMLAAASTSAFAQTSDDVSNSIAAAASSPGDWTQFHQDNMQRWNPSETVIGVGNVKNLQSRWKSSTVVQSISAYTESSPAVAGGVLYVGSDDRHVYALNADTGAILWSLNTGFRVATSPAVAAGIVYVDTDNSQTLALNATTGTRRWISNDGGYVASPAVANGVIYVCNTQFATIYALNASTGAELWSRFLDVGIVYVYTSPAVANGIVYVGTDTGDNRGSHSGHLHALNTSTGSELWSYDPGDAVYSSPAVANGVVYFSALHGTFYALNASTGAKLWSFATGATELSSPAVANGVVYFNSGDGSLYALNASTGAKLWAFPHAGGSTSPAVANGVVYVSNGATIYALNASSGAKLWSYPIGDLSSSPAISNGAVYIQGVDQVTKVATVYAFALPGGADLSLRIQPTPTTVHQGDLLTYASPIWNLGPDNAENEVLNTQVPAGTTFDYIRISGTPGLGTCTHPPYGGTGQIICHEGDGMAPNTTWTVRLTVRVTAPAGTLITANAATMSDTPDPNLDNNTATVSLTVQ